MDNLIHKVIMNKQYPVKYETWNITMSLLLRYIIYGNQHRLTIQNMTDKLITVILEKHGINKF